jgi:hypothetical protein
MALDGSPLAALAQQGAEAANLIVTEKSAGVPRREPSVGGNDHTRHARSEATSLASPNHHLSELEHDGASLRAMLPENMTVNKMTSATLLKIGGILGAELRPHRDGL